jgi:hypothetical protein
LGECGCGLGGETLGRKAAVLIGRLRTPRRADPGRRSAEVEPDSDASPSRARRRETSLTGGPRVSAIQMLLNLNLKIKFKWKTKNKIMQ